jgi:soluble lytic murein transglycosylase-like protein
LAAGLIGCQTPPEPGPLQDMTIIPHRHYKSSPASEGLKRLRQVIAGHHPQWQASAKPLITGLTAQVHYDQNQWDLAQAGWLQLLRSEAGNLGEWAFEQWVASYQKILRRNATAEVLAKILLAETDQGKQSAYLSDRELTELSELVPKIKLLLGQGVDQLAEDSVGPPETPGRPAEDPLLTATIQAYCFSDNQQEWTPWLRGLAPLERRYWELLVAGCREDQDRLRTLLPRLVDELEAANYPGLLVEVAHRWVTYYRSVGDREGAAAAYRRLVAALAQEGLKAEHLGLEPFELHYYRANQVLWGSRYRALIGDYLTARDWVQRAFQIIDNTYAQGLSLTADDEQSLEELRAEGYHILAFRISYELDDFEAALIQTKLGARIDSLDEDWRFRFAWYEGFYQWRSGRLEEAATLWQTLLDDELKPDEEDRLLFWLAYLQHEAGNQDQATELFDQLCHGHPFSFYAVAAARYVDWSAPDCSMRVQWMAAAQEQAGREVAILPHADELRHDSDIAPLLYRAELAIKTELGALERLTVQDLYASLRRGRRLQEDPASFLYVSRLLYAVEDYHRAMALTYEVSLVQDDLWEVYPDQIQVFFPQPYWSLFQRNANRFYLEPSLLLAIARQESSFRPEVTSYAGAVGLLQLIPPTAEKYRRKIGLKVATTLHAALQEPEWNMSVGAAYLADLSRRYKQDLPRIASAYNAGEYAVDAWTKRRAAEKALTWIESIPFGQTQNYVKAVLRNDTIYRELLQGIQTADKSGRTDQVP